MYQVLYRKWRPQTFADVYGQPAVVTALKNELRTGRLAHAYLFTGSRGTGKTSCAKILAKAVNCLHPVDGDPCNQCDICKGLDAGTILDVVEIDAASNNGVDNIRDLRDEVYFTPVAAKYRVYIIDEVHMLSIGAFNALLKTLEEPPEHAIFILATTEVHKLPATILSRCQRFDFGRISPADLAARMQQIAGQEGFTLTEEAALLLARLADGGMRDALSLLDQCLARSREITAEVVYATTGMAGNDCLYDLSAAVVNRDGGQALTILDQLHAASKDMERLCAELIEFYRQLMIIKSVPNPGDLIVAASGELNRLSEEAAKYSLPAILHCMDVLQRALERLRGGVSRRIEMEMALLKLSSPQLDMSSEALLRRMKQLEEAVSAGTGMPAAAPAVVTPPVETPPKSKGGSKPQPALPAPPVEKGESPAPAASKPESPPLEDGNDQEERPFDHWGEVLSHLSDSCKPLFGVLNGSTALIRGNLLLIQTDNELFRQLVNRDNNKELLSAAVQAVTGRRYRIGMKKAAPAPAEKAPAPTDPLGAFLQQSQEMGVPVITE